MTPFRVLIGSFIFFSAWFTAARSAGADKPAGFIPLFNGRDLSGWRGGDLYNPRELRERAEPDRTALIAGWTAALTAVNPTSGKPHWRAEKGELISDGFGGHATTEKDFGDFELRAEYRATSSTEGDVYLRGVPTVQIGRSARDQASSGPTPLFVTDQPAKAWSRLRILILGSRVSIWSNDQLVIDHKILENSFDRERPLAQRLPILPRGPIALSSHGGEMRWRDIMVREIGGDEAGQILASRDTTGYRSIFNGHDLTGWTGDLGTSVAEVKDGAIIWVQGKKGTLYWNETLANFQARVFFKLPPGGNNGLAIRYPGKGVAAFAGMTEIQVLDDNYEKVRGKIDPRQAHGSAAEMVAAARGYQRPIGEWNFQEVTVQGSRVKVELNGTVILDTDLADVGPANYNRGLAHPGKDRKEGFFGFAGHNDPVAFKDIFIRPL